MSAAEAGPVRLAVRMGQVAPSAIGAVLRLGDRSGVISLAGGLPSDEGLPAEDVADVAAKVLFEGTGGLQYGATDGLPPLREWLAGQLAEERGIHTSAENVLVVNGSQQGLDLVAKVLLDPGDVVVVDRPSYIGAMQVFRLYQAQLVEMPLAGDPDLAAFASALERGLRPRLVYMVPNYANPSGLSIDEPARDRLAELAERFGFVIVEDDPYHDLWFDRERPAVAALAARTGRCVHLGSFSKSLFPGSKVGYLSAPPDLVGALRLVRQAADLGNSDLLQRVALELVRDGRRHQERLRALRASYRERRDALAAALTRRMPGAEFAVPGGGFFLWVRLAAGQDAAELLPKALDHGVSFVPGEAFYVDAPDRGMARLAFSGLPAHLADTAAERLALAVGAL